MLGSSYNPVEPPTEGVNVAVNPLFTFTAETINSVIHDFNFE